MVAEPRACACGCGVALKTPGARFTTGHNARMPAGQGGNRATLNCAYCGQEFTAVASPQRAYCRPACKGADLSRWELDNGLKKRFVGQLRARRIGVPAAADEAGVKAITLYMWLQRPGHRLRAATIAAVAQWLRIEVETATALQGGDVKEKYTAIVAASLASPKRAAHLERLRIDPAYRERVMGPSHEAARRSTRSPEWRERQSEAVKRGFDRTGYRPTGRHKKTLRGRAQSAMIKLRYWHPDWTPQQIETESIRRLMAPPFNVKTAEAAAALLAPKPKPRAIRRRAARRPHRCVLLSEMDAEAPRTPGGKRRYGFLEDFARRLREIEGDTTPDYTVLKVWIDRHTKQCRERHDGWALISVRL